MGAGLDQPMHGDVGQFPLLCILARGLAELGGRCGDVEHVVGDLEGEPDGLTEQRDGFTLRPSGTTGDGAQFARRADQSGGFAPVDALQPLAGVECAVDRFARGVEIVLLALHHRDTRTAEHGHRFSAKGRRGEEGERLERISGEDGSRLVKGLVTGRPSAAQVIVVHRRQVVMDQGVGVQRLDRD